MNGAGNGHVGFSPDGSRIVTTQWFRNARVWDAKDGRPLATLGVPSTSSIYNAVFLSDNRNVLVAKDSDAVLWDTVADKVIRTYKGHTDLIWQLAVSPDSARVVTCSFDGTVNLWASNSGKLLHSFSPQKAMTSAVAFSPDGRTFATGGRDGTVRIWDAQTFERHLDLNGHTSEVASIAYSPDGKTLATASHDSSIRLWDTETGEQKGRYLGHSGIIRTIAFARDGKHLLTGGGDASIRMWRFPQGQIKHLSVRTTEYPIGFTFDSRHFITATRGNYTLWDLQNLEPLSRQLLPPLVMERTTAQLPVLPFFSPDGQQYATGSTSGEVLVSKTGAGSELYRLRTNVVNIRQMAFSSDGKYLVIGGQSEIAVWDTQVKRKIRSFIGSGFGQFSRDGRHLMIVMLGQEIINIEIYQMKPCRKLYSLSNTRKELVNVFVFENDRIVFVKRMVKGKRQISVKELATGYTLLSIVNDYVTRYQGFALSPDSNVLAVSNNDSTVDLWDVHTKKLTGTLRGLFDHVTSLTFSHDGRRIATGSEDHAVRVWDSRSGQQLLILRDSSVVITNVGFSPDDSVLWARSEPGDCYFWHSDGQSIHKTVSRYH